MEDWAETKAREWLVEKWQPDLQPKITSLAALLREVRLPEDLPLGGMCRDDHVEIHYSLNLMGDDERCPACKLRDDLLAEVRRVVEDVYERDEDMPPHKRDEILSRLESL